MGGIMVHHYPATQGIALPAAWEEVHHGVMCWPPSQVTHTLVTALVAVIILHKTRKVCDLNYLITAKITELFDNCSHLKLEKFLCVFIWDR